MLTNIYYYGHYRPYLLDSINSKSTFRKNTKEASQKKSGEDFSYFLNKTLKNEVVQYASDIASNFNAIRDTARFIERYANSSNDISDALHDFTEQYNDYVDFAEEKQDISSVLGKYKETLEYRIDEKSDLLSSLGISKDSTGKLTYNNDGQIFSSELSSQLSSFAKDVYNDTIEVMRMPLSEHMNFKGLDYYYNYMYARVDSSSFKVIETGMLVDIKL